MDFESLSPTFPQLVLRQAVLAQRGHGVGSGSFHNLDLERDYHRPMECEKCAHCCLPITN